MPTYLDEILEHKKSEIPTLPEGPERERPAFEFSRSLAHSPFIAEVKKASPSAGIIAENFDPLARARLYEDAGVGGISVLTDGRFFGGSFEFLRIIGEEVDVPLLCKDFIIDERQIDLAWGTGADMVLLIAAVLDKDRLRDLASHAWDLELDVLFELHDMEEWKKIESIDPAVVGVNARNLSTFDIELERSAATLDFLRRRYPELLLVAESGIRSPLDVALYHEAGADAFLVGTHLMKSEDPAAELESLQMGLE